MDIRSIPLEGNQNARVFKIGSVYALFSYQTLVCFHSENGNYQTNVKYSQTTTKHINKFKAHYGLFQFSEVPQEELEKAFIEALNSVST